MAIPATPVTSNGGGPKLELLTSPGTDGEVTNFTELKKKWADAFEREYLVSTLARHGGNVSAASREAKLDRSNFLRLLRRHAVKAQEYRAKDTTTKIAA